MTTSRSALSSICALAMLTLAACDGIGRALVDERQGTVQYRVPCVDGPHDCQQGLPERPALTPPLSVALPFAACAPTSGACSPPLMWPPSLGPSPSNLVGCSLNATLSAPDAPPFAPASCAELQLTPVASATLVRIPEVSTTASTLTLASETPVVVELAGASLSGTRVTLRGPVTLRLIDQSVVQDVWMREEPAANGMTGASLQLVESRAESLSLGPLTGQIKMVRSTLSHSKLWADHVVLEAVSLSDVSVVSPELDGLELSGKGLVLQVGRATLSRLELKNLDVQRCDSMLIVSSSLSTSTFGACTDKLRLDYAVVSESVLVGAIESTRGTWLTNTLGVAGAPTTVELWGDTLLGNRFCPAVARAAFGEEVTLTCNMCDELPTPEQRLCPAKLRNENEPGFSMLVPEDNPSCPILAELETLPLCSPPVRNENPTVPF